MLIAKRRFIVAGAAIMAAGTVAAAAAIRKPAPVIFTPVSDPNVEKATLQNASTLESTVPAHPVTAFSFIDAAGAEHSIADYAGRGVVVNFWATWCPPCVAELPALARMAGMLAAEGIAVLALSVDRGGTEKVKGYFRDNAISGLEVLADPKSVAARALNTRGVPTTIIIDRAGRETARLEGPADWAGHDLVQAVRRLTA